jgi:rhamnosyltransferase
MNKTVSLIIRTKNEERWISSCLESVFSQEFKDFEVVIVDNNSTDKTLEKVRRYNQIRIVTVDEYLPGKALNAGIKASSGRYIVCLSGHCIPVNNVWLGSLLKNIKLRGVAGVYGRQQPLSYSSDFDKRDLLITFGLDRKVQIMDSFFHNANSMIRRSVWEEVPFDDEISNIEDRIWAREVIKKGYKIIYEPSASVYHYHGIHQNGNLERCQNIVKILEKLETDHMRSSVDPGKITVISAIPVRNGTQFLGNRPLLDYTLRRSRESRYIKYTVVAAEDDKTLSLAKKLGADFCFKRPPDLSREYVDIQDILRFCVDELEKQGIIPDVVVYLSANCPFRKKGFIDQIIEQLANGGYDSILPAIREYKSCWINESGTMKRVDEGFIPSKMKHPLHIGISGLGTATYGDIIRHGDRLGYKVGMVEIDDITQTIDVGKQGGLNLAELIIEKWWEQN